MLTNRVNCYGSTFNLTLFWRVVRDLRALCWLVGWLVVFYVRSTARSFRDGTPIYCPLPRTWSLVFTHLNINELIAPLTRRYPSLKDTFLVKKGWPLLWSHLFYTRNMSFRKFTPKSGLFQRVWPLVRVASQKRFQCIHKWNYFNVSDYNTWNPL